MFFVITRSVCMLCSAKSSPCIARFILTTTLVRYPYYPHCISCLLLCSQLQLKTKTVYYLTASVGQESGRSLAGGSGSVFLRRRSSRCGLGSSEGLTWGQCVSQLSHMFIGSLRVLRLLAGALSVFSVGLLAALQLVSPGGREGGRRRRRRRREKRERVRPRWKPQSFDLIISEVMSHCFCHIFYSLGAGTRSSHSQGEGTTKGYEYRRGRSSGTLLETASHTHFADGGTEVQRGEARKRAGI